MIVYHPIIAHFGPLVNGEFLGTHKRSCGLSWGCRSTGTPDQPVSASRWQSRRKHREPFAATDRPMHSGCAARDPKSGRRGRLEGRVTRQTTHQWNSEKESGA